MDSIGYNYFMPCLPVKFYQADVILVARRLLGMRLVRNLDGLRISGRIVETEAYRGEEDLACHAHTGRTSRNAMLYERAGRAYVYFTYGMHWLVNAVAGETGYPAAVLIRAIQPLEGLEEIRARRAGKPPEQWCDGPAKLCQALGIRGELNGIDLCREADGLWIEEEEPIPEDRVKISPRIGLGSTPEPWKSKPWRFYVDAGSN